MPWQLLSLEIPARVEQSLTDLLFAAGATTVSVLPLGVERILEPPPGETPLWSDCRLTAQFEGERDLQPLRRLCDTMGLNTWIELLPDQPWEAHCRRDWAPLCFGERLWIVPGGEFLATQEADCQLFLDPGLAFGTGSHPTTGLCLDWLTGCELTGRSLLDYGCGSGILALAAARLGAAPVVATDIDPQALTAARDNSRRNHLDRKITVVSEQRLRTEWLGRQNVDILIANIVIRVLAELMPVFARLVSSGGSLVLSGVLTRQEQWLEQLLAPHFRAQRRHERDGWLLLQAVRQ